MSACRQTRKEFIWQMGCGFAGLGLLDLLSNDGFFTNTAYANNIIPKAKSVIFLYMYGGPSQIDTFDYKPELLDKDGKTINVKSFRNNGQVTPLTISSPKWKFKQYGKSGQWVSDLFPHVGSVIDEICLIKSMVADSPIHGSAMLQMNTGKILSGSPSIGSWLNYGLGSENKNLPGFMVMLDPSGGPINGAKNWSSGYMPATFQGTVLRAGEKPILDLDRPANMNLQTQRDVIDTLQMMNREHYSKRSDNTNLAARIKAYEMAYQMQTAAPEAVDLSREPQHIKDMYGLDNPTTADFGQRCLLARRMVERGVRYIQLYSGGSNTNFMNFWDAHGGIVANHNHLSGKVDKPIAALIKDLKQRGLLDTTLVVWGGEFGRTPHSTGDGRDHHASCFTMWMAGGGIKGGISYGESDETGHEVGKDPVSVKQLHATILNQMGIDPNRLSYYYGGLDQKLVGVEHVDPILSIRK
jgi:hypothetical protein